MASAKSPRDSLMHSNGTTPLETISVIIPSLFYTTTTTVLVSLLVCQTKNIPLQFCLEFATLVVPCILNLTILADYSVQVLTTSAIICFSTLFFVMSLKPGLKKIESSRDVITNSRSTINILSVISILAVDFLIFPRRFAKTESFGYSLMDVGVGLFIFSNGIVDSGPANLIKSLKSSIPLFLLGTARFLVTKQIEYHVPVSEYGLHWNFFITLAATKIFTSLILSVVNVRFVWINATLLMISHEILLQMGLKNLVMSNTKRTDFFLANKEGLVSSMGYVCLYLYSAFFSYFLGLKNIRDRTRKVILKFAFLSVLCLALTFILEKNFGVSRKLANSAYCFWVLFIGIFMTGLYYIAGEVLRNVLLVEIHLPYIFRAINYNGLVFFLASNLLTGLINTACDSLKVGSVNSLIIITVYMFVNCSIVCVLYQKRMKLKML